MLPIVVRLAQACRPYLAPLKPETVKLIAWGPQLSVTAPASLVKGHPFLKLLDYLRIFQYRADQGKLAFVGAWNMIKGVGAVTFDIAEKWSLPAVGADLVYHFVREGRPHLGSFGSSAAILFSGRLASQFLGVGGTRILFLLDRTPDVFLQMTSGQTLSEIDGFRVFMSYTSGTLLGHLRGQFWMNVLGRAPKWGARFMPRIVLRVNGHRSKVHALRSLSKEECDVVGRLAGGASIWNRVWVTSAQASKAAPAAHSVSLTKKEADVLKTLLMRNGRSVSLDDSTAIELIPRAGFLGSAAVFAINDIVTGFPIEYLRWETVMRGDGWNGMRYHAFRLPSLFVRSWWKAGWGWQDPIAVVGTSGIRNFGEPPLSKFAPVFSGSGFWKKNYVRDALGGTPGGFLEYHIAPRVYEGGLSRWNTTTVKSWFDPKVIEERSPYTPNPRDYRDLAEWYAADGGPGPESMRQADFQLDCVLAEIEYRKAYGNIAHDRSLQPYSTPILVQQAMAISAAALYAYHKDRKRFAKSLQNHADWFDGIDSQPFDFTKADGVEAFVNKL